MTSKIAGIFLPALTMGVATLSSAQAADGDAIMHRGGTIRK